MPPKHFLGTSKRPSLDPNDLQSDKGSQKAKKYTSDKPVFYRFKSSTDKPEIVYNFSRSEAAYTASAHDVEQDKDGMVLFAGSQAAAAGFLAVAAHKIKDVGSFETGITNLFRNVAWVAVKLSAKNLESIKVVPQSLKRRWNHYAHQTLKQSEVIHLLEKNDVMRDKIAGVKKSLRKSEKQALKEIVTIQRGIKDTYGQQMVQDKIQAKINAGFAGIGSVVHVPQMVASPEPIVQVGAGMALAAYFLIAADQTIEAKRWGQEYDKRSKKNFKYDAEVSHLLVGYVARGEYIKDAVFKWLPYGLLTGKGAAYLYEAYALAQHSAPTAAVACMAASGAIFTGFSLYELKEQNGNKFNYICKKTGRKISDTATSIFEQAAQQWHDFKEPLNYSQLAVMPKTPSNRTSMLEHLGLK